MQASALMIVSLLAQKASLAPNVAKSLLHSVADMARTDAKEGRDMRWLRMSVMTIISIVQVLLPCVTFMKLVKKQISYTLYAYEYLVSVYLPLWHY